MKLLVAVVISVFVVGTMASLAKHNHPRRSNKSFLIKSTPTPEPTPGPVWTIRPEPTPEPTPPGSETAKKGGELLNEKSVSD